tara:strand:+ start:61 stop:537 length:477 start_codon:yes stop_codon:yes gene_type:complete
MSNQLPEGYLERNFPLTEGSGIPGGLKPHEYYEPLFRLYDYETLSDALNLLNEGEVDYGNGDTAKYRFFVKLSESNRGNTNPNYEKVIFDKLYNLVGREFFTKYPPNYTGDLPPGPGVGSSKKRSKTKKTKTKRSKTKRSKTKKSKSKKNKTKRKSKK